MRRNFTIIFIALLVSSPALATESFKWVPGIYLNLSPEKITMLYGPPTIVKTERKFAEFVKNKGSGCGNLKIYGFSWSLGTAGDLVLNGPLGLASSAEIWFENDKSYSVKWEYEGNQQEAGMERWRTSKEIPIIVSKKPSVIIIGTWKPNPETSAFVHCYSGGDSRSCKGTITVEFMFDYEK